MRFTPRFTKSDVQVLAREPVFTGHFSVSALTLRHRRFKGDWSAVLRREIFERGDAVGVLPWNPVTDELILIEQFRPGALRPGCSPWMLELVAGVVEAGEDDVAVAHREAWEEAGCVMDRLLPIATFFPSVGACSEQVRLFIGRVTEAAVGQIAGLASEHEDILVHALPRSDVLAILDDNGIQNGHTLIALQWLARKGDQLRDVWCRE